MNFQRLTATNGLIIINIFVFIVGLFFQKPALFGIAYPDGQPTSVFEILGAYSWFSCFSELQIWRLISYQFLHANFGHILFNMWGLYFFGPAVESLMGPKKFLAFYLICGVAGALCSSLLADMGLYSSIGEGSQAAALCQYIAQYAGYSGSVEPWQMVPLIGASASVYGVMVATAFLYPHVKVSLIFPPVTMTLRSFALWVIGIASATVLFNWSNAGGEAGHLGGIIMGAILMIFQKHSLLRGEA